MDQTRQILLQQAIETCTSFEDKIEGAMEALRQFDPTLGQPKATAQPWLLNEGVPFRKLTPPVIEKVKKYNVN